MEFVAPSANERWKCLGFELVETRTRYTGWDEKKRILHNEHTPIVYYERD